MINKMQIGTIDLSNGETLCYREAGQGENTILFIHGNMSSSKHWEPVLKTIPQGFKGYAIDLRGLGESTYNKPIDSLKDLADDTKLFIDLKGLKNLTVVGWSTGGGIAMELAADYPELIKKIVLVESVSYKGYPIFRKDEKGQPIIGEFYKTREEMALDPIQVIPAQRAMEAKDYGVMKFIWDAAIYVNKKPEEKEYNEFLTATLQQRNLVDIDWALATFNLSNEHNGMVEGNGKIDKITVPVLSIWGDKDVVVLRHMVEDTVNAIGENARLVIYNDCGHSPITDCTEKLISDIANFVKE